MQNRNGDKFSRGIFFLELQILLFLCGGSHVEWSFCPNVRFSFARVDMLGLPAWSDDLNVVLFEFLEDDTKPNQPTNQPTQLRVPAPGEERLLEHMHKKQPTVILRRKSEYSEKCSPVNRS